MTFTEIAFSPRTLPDGDPVEAMKDYVGRTLIRLDITLPDADTPLDYRVGLHQSPAAQWGFWSSRPVLFERTRDLLTDGSDDVMIALLDAPIVMRLADGQDFVVQHGDALLFSQARAFGYRLPHNTRGWTLRMPHHELRALLPDLDEAPMRLLSRHTPGLGLLRAYLRATTADRLDGQAARHLAGRHLQDLAALVIKGGALAVPERVEGSVLLARRGAIDAQMQAHLNAPDFDLDRLAVRMGFGPRQIQRVFAAGNTTFSDELRRLRLERAAAMLVDETAPFRSINTIALDVGFADVPTFNRAFKRHFGLTPSDMRNAQKR